MSLNLDNFTISGIVLWIISLCILLFQGIATAMEKGEEMTNILLCDINYDIFIVISDKIPFNFLKTCFDYVSFEISLFLLLMIIGTLLIIIGMFLKD